MKTKLSQRCCAFALLAVVDFPPRPNSVVPPGVPANRGGNGVPPEIVEREVGVVLRHVITVPDWSPESTPKGIPLSVGRPYVAIGMAA